MNPGFHNIISGHGFETMLTGMLIVFFGLSFLSGFIVILAKVVDQKQPVKASRPSDTDTTVAEPTAAELIAVTALVIYLETERSLGEGAQITIPRQSRHGSIWASAGKMRSLSEGGPCA